MNLPKVYIGVDISKENLDIYFYPIKKTFKISNSKTAISTFVKGLSQFNVEQIACESTGGYEKLLANILKKNSYKIWVVDPRRIKGFIVATGCKGKTDKIDAKKIAEFAHKNCRDYESFNKTENEIILQSLVNRRLDLTKFVASEKTRLKHPSHELSFVNIKCTIDFLEKQINDIEKQIKILIKKDNDLKQKSQLLESIPGIGETSAAVLLSFLPELGKIGDSKISALVGLCPYDNESGKHKGKKFIRGGRKIPRNILYMCALTTIKYNIILKSFYNRLIQKAKPFKVAIVAVMHKLIILANAVLRKGEPCRV